jgi:hypothetical protein
VLVLWEAAPAAHRGPLGARVRFPIDQSRLLPVWGKVCVASASSPWLVFRQACREMRVVLLLRFVVNDGVATRAVPGTTAHTAAWMGSMIGVLVVFDPLVPVPPRRYLAAAGTGGCHSTTLRLSDRPAFG